LDSHWTTIIYHRVLDALSIQSSAIFLHELIIDALDTKQTLFRIHRYNNPQNTFISLADLAPTSNYAFEVLPNATIDIAFSIKLHTEKVC